MRPREQFGYHILRSRANHFARIQMAVQVLSKPSQPIMANGRIVGSESVTLWLNECQLMRAKIFELLLNLLWFDKSKLRMFPNMLSHNRRHNMRTSELVSILNRLLS
jgi:hypothetical protein